eukprot:7252599-Pyramimonas_sp.AAC.1
MSVSSPRVDTSMHCLLKFKGRIKLSCGKRASIRGLTDGPRLRPIGGPPASGASQASSEVSGESRSGSSRRFRKA